MRITEPPHGVPPLSDTLHRESGAAMVRPHIDPAHILPQIVDAVGCILLLSKVMYLNRFRFSLGLPLATAVLIISDLLFLFGVDRNGRLPLAQKFLSLRIYVLKLRVPVRV